MIIIYNILPKIFLYKNPSRKVEASERKSLNSSDELFFGDEVFLHIILWE